MTVVSDVEIRLRADIARLRQDLQDARREVTGAVNGMSASVEKFKGVLGGLATGAAVAGFANIVKHSIDAADALNDMSVRTKVAIEDLAGLAYAAKLGDTSLEGVAGAISKLGMNIGKDGAKFRELGITATEPLEAFKQLADIFKNIQDPQQRAAFGAEALGKSWQEAAVLLDGGSEGISTLVERGKELSGITEQVAADAGAFNDKIDELGFAAQGAATRVAAGLLPTLQKIADAFSASAVNGEEMSGVVTVLSGTLKGLYTVGKYVSTILTVVGKGLGATAAATVAALSGDFKGAAEIYRLMGEDLTKTVSGAANTITNLWSDSGEAATAAATETKTAGDKIADSLIAQATAVKVATFLNAGEIDAARKKSAAEAEAARKKEAASYAGLIASIKEKMAADQLEIEGAAAVTPIQQARIKLDQELASGKLVLTKEHIKEARALLGSAEAMERNANAAKQSRAAVAALADERDKSYEAMVAEAAANEELAKTYGKTKLEIAQMTLAVEEDRLARRGELELSEDTVAQLEREIEVRKRNIAAISSVEALEQQAAFWKSIDKTAHDTFVSIANGGKDAATRLKETFKNVFFDWLYQQTIKKWIINIGTATDTSTVAGAASALSGGSGGIASLFGSSSNLISVGKMIYSGFTSGIASSLGGTISSLGATFGSEAVAAFGAGLQGGALGAGTASAASGYAGTTAAGFGASAASAIPIIGWIIAGMQAANSFAKQGFTPNNGTISNVFAKAFTSPTNMTYKALEKLGVGSSLANILSGAAINTKLFGRADPRVEAQGLRGTVSAAGIDAESYAKIIEKGGLFRSSKRYEKTAELAAATDTAFDDTIKSMISAVKGFAGVVGIEASTIDGYTKAFDLALTGDATKDDEIVAKLFGDIGDELSLRLVPSLASFQLEGETLSTTLQRLSADYATVDAAFSAIGKSMGVVGAAGITARENLIAAAGGLETLVSGISYFQQNYLTEEQRLAPVRKAVTEQLAAMGQSGLKTTEQFAAATLAIDTSTEAGAKLFAQMLALAPAFKEVADAQAAATKAAQDLADANAADALDKIARAAGLLTGAVDAALNGVTRAVDQGKQAAKDAYDALTKAIDANVDAVTSRISDLQSLSSLLGQRVVATGAAQSSITRQVAGAAIAAAAHVAQQTGVLPAADAIRDAVGALRSDSADNYDSMLDYQRAAARANNDLAVLGDLTDTQLSVARNTLTVLRDQKAMALVAYDAEVSRLDGILATAKASVDKLNGIDSTTRDISATLATLAVAIKAAQANPVSNAGAATQDAYSQYLGRPATQAEIDYWKSQIAAGADVTGAVKNSDEARIQELYQKYLGRTGEAAGVAAWEQSLAAGHTWDQIEASFAGSAEAQGRATSLASAVDNLTAQMGAMQNSMARTANATAKLADQFDQVSGGGNALITET